ncbi:MAG: hypothetical protein WCD68_15375, partial [Candidatus Acidiferrum sp.]
MDSSPLGWVPHSDAATTRVTKGRGALLALLRDGTLRMLDMLAWRVRDVQGNRASVAVDSMNSSTPKERIESWRDRTGAVTVRITGIVEARMEPEGTVTVKRPGH